jgi:hypothetical protein
MPKSWGEHHQTTEIGIFLGFMACGKRNIDPKLGMQEWIQ